MKYIVFENIYNMFIGWNYKRTEIKTDKELKEYLFKHRDNLSNIEIFNKSDKCNDIAIKIFLFNEIPKDEYCYSIVGYFDKETEYENLGTYKTKERALEVLDKIQNCLIINLTTSENYEEADIQIKGNILGNMTKIFIMPKE